MPEVKMTTEELYERLEMREAVQGVRNIIRNGQSALLLLQEATVCDPRIKQVLGMVHDNFDTAVELCGKLEKYLGPVGLEEGEEAPYGDEGC